MLKLLFFVFAACSGTKATGPSPDPQETASDTAAVIDTSPPDETAEDSAEETATETAEDTAPEPEPTVTAEDAGGVDDAAGWLFSSEEVIPIDITFSEDAAATLNADPYSFVSADISIKGMEVTNIGIRLKGKIGSFRALSGKAAFKVDFNAFVPDQSFYGLKKFNLNNSVVDCSYMKEHISYKIFRDAGLPAERVGYAWVTVNGEAYGLYNILEQLDMPFLERNFEDPTGNLYDGKYIWYGGYSYTLLDFVSSVQDLYVLEEGTDVDNKDIAEVVSAISSSAGTSAYYDTVGAEVNWDEVLAYFAAEQWTGQNDGYVLNTNNNYLYFDPVDGKMKMIPWDLDYSLLNDYDWGMNWASPKGVLAYYCFFDTTCKAAWAARAAVLLDTIDEEALKTQVETWATLVNPYAEIDPRRECSFGQVIDYQSYVQSWIKGRSAYMTGFWGL